MGHEDAGFVFLSDTGSGIEPLGAVLTDSSGWSCAMSAFKYFKRKQDIYIGRSAAEWMQTSEVSETCNLKMEPIMGDFDGNDRWGVVYFLQRGGQIFVAKNSATPRQINGQYSALEFHDIGTDAARELILGAPPAAEQQRDQPQEAADDGMITVVLKTLTGQTKTLRVLPNTPTNEFFEMASDALNTPSDIMRLIYAGRRLDEWDDAPIEELGMHDGSLVHMVLRMGGHPENRAVDQLRILVRKMGKEGYDFHEEDMIDFSHEKIERQYQRVDGSIRFMFTTASEPAYNLSYEYGILLRNFTGQQSYRMSQGDNEFLPSSKVVWHMLERLGLYNPRQPILLQPGPPHSENEVREWSTDIFMRYARMYRVDRPGQRRHGGPAVNSYISSMMRDLRV